jgi:NAD(P)-dependent dehydrogenase (short-subunit alcohol dehydrogenase family)
MRPQGTDATGGVGLQSPPAAVPRPSSEAEWITVVEAVISQHQRLDVLGNNPGIGISATVVEMSLADWRHQRAANLDGVFQGMKHSTDA